MSNSVRVDLSMDQGADFAVEIYWSNYNNLPFEVVTPMRMEVRNSVGTVAITFVADSTSPDMSDITIRYNTELGLVQLVCPAATTSSVPPGQYFYDLFVTYNDTVLNVITGVETVTPRIVKIMHGLFIVNGRVTQNV